MKAEPSRLIPRMLTENLELLVVGTRFHLFRTFLFALIFSPPLLLHCCGVPKM